MQRRHMIVLLASAAIGGSNALQASQTGEQGQCNQDHVAWVVEVMERMATIKPGMTRKKLLTVFATEGGLSTPLQRTFASRDCPYFQVDVEFQAVGRPDLDEDGRVTSIEDGEDRILTMSRPYLEFHLND